jgi:cytochrome c oxidase subunit 3
MTEATASIPFDSPANNERTKKMVLYIGIFSIVMLFAGFSSAYVISSYAELWVSITLPTAFYISTALILLSSLTMKLSVDSAQGGNESKAKQLLALTLILGLGFGLSQFIGWDQLLGKGSFLSGHVDNLDGVYGEDYSITYKGQELIFEQGEYYFPNDDLREKPLTDEIAVYSNSAASYIYALSFVHLLHVLGGILFLAGLLIYAYLPKGKGLNPLRLKLGGIYWHFVDGLWLYLLRCLHLKHQTSTKN